MSERNNYQAFKEHVIGLRDRVDRIENGVSVGMPDVNVCIEGRESWLELKSPTEPVRPTTPLFGSNHRVSQEQANWMLRQRRAGGRCYFLIVTDRRWVLVDGVHADRLNKMTVEELLLESMWAAPKPIRDKELWTQLRNVLKA